MADYSGKKAPTGKYFASLPTEEAVPILKKKSQDWFDSITGNSYLDKVKKSWKFYHGIFSDDNSSGHGISFGGEQGELVDIPINHYRNFAQHILVMVTANRPSFQARATNTDYKSLVQTNLANSLLDYYMREKRLERFLKDSVEQAIVLGTGYIKMDWNSTIGEIVDFNEETNSKIYEGDVVFKNLSPFDVAFDSTRESSNNSDWVITRTWLNKYALAAKYPEKEQEIIKLSTKSDDQKFRLVGPSYDETDDIAVYEFYHIRNEAMPDGRYLLFLDDDIALLDVPIPYRDLPIYRISPSDILGTPYGYTGMWDIIPIQEGINSLNSVIMSNQNAFGVQNILNPRGSDISISALSGALNVIDYNPMHGVEGGGKPESLNLTNTPREIFEYLQMLERFGETISGVNPVARGNAEAVDQLRSGNALALVQSQALQFMSGLQQSYVQLTEDVGTGLINMLKDFAAVPRVAAIAGRSNRTQMKEFSGDDLSQVNRVIIDVGNPLAHTVAGKIQMADNLLQMFGDKLNPSQYFNVLNTGRLDTLTDGESKQVLLIRAENEMLVEGSGEVRALATDAHKIHIQEHRDVLSDPVLRQDEELVKRTTKHILEHVELLRNTDADTLVLLEEQPLGPAGGSPANQGDDSPNQSQGQMPMKNQDENAQSQAARMQPNIAQPAQSPDGPVMASEVPIGGA